MGAPFSVGISITSSGVAAAPAAPVSRFATLADVAKHAASTHVAALGDLSDVDTAGVVDADVLTFNVLTGLWEPAPAGAGAIALDDLTDVDVAGALDGKILRKVAGVWQDADETPVSLGLDDLTDVDVAGALDGTILKKVAGVWQDAAEPGVPALDDLTDVDVAGAPDGKVLKKVGGIWQDADDAGATALDDLSDVDTTGLADNHILRYDLASALWKPEAVPVPALDDLTDVNTAGLADNDVLQYNLASGQWEPDPLPGPPALDDLTDVDVAGAADGKILKKVAGVWQDAAESGGGGKSFITSPGLKPPTTADGGDIEFSAYANTTDPTAAPGLTWGNQGSATAAINSGRLIFASGTTAGSLRALMKATPGAGNFTVATSVNALRYLNSQSAGLVFLWGTPASPTAIEEAGTYYLNANLRANWSQYNTSYVVTADRITTTTQEMLLGAIYLRVVWNGTTLVYAISPSAIADTWQTIYTATLGRGRPDYVGVGVATNGAANPVLAAFDFLRFNWSATDFDPTVDD